MEVYSKEVIVDNPLAIIHKNVTTKLSNEEAEIIIGDKDYKIDNVDIKSKNLFDDIRFGSIIDYEVINNKLMVRVSGQITPARFIGDIIITYEYHDKMFEAKSIEFIMDIDKNPFYGPGETLSDIQQTNFELGFPLLIRNEI